MDKKTTLELHAQALAAAAAKAGFLPGGLKESLQAAAQFALAVAADNAALRAELAALRDSWAPDTTSAAG